MDYFMPSDIARMVLGYLKDHGYLKTYTSFMKECSLLHEYYSLVKAGRQPHLTLPNLNLMFILNEWGQYKQKEQASHLPGNSSLSSNESSPDNTLITDNDVTKSKKSTPKGGKSASQERSCGQKSGSCSSEKHDSRNMGRHFRSRESIEGRSETTRRSNTYTSPTKSSVNVSPKKYSDKNSRSSTCNTNGALSCTRSPVKSVSAETQTASLASCLSVKRDANERRLMYTKESVPCNDIVKDNVEDTGNAVRDVEASSGSVTITQQTLGPVLSGQGCVSKDVTSAKSRNGVKNGDQCESNEKCVGDIQPDQKKEQVLTEKVLSQGPGSSVGKAETCPLKGMLESGPLALLHVTPKKCNLPIPVDGSLVTPVKLFQQAEEITNKSPRRKKPKTPRKRTSDVHEAQPSNSAANHVEDPIFQEILSDTRLHEKLAETCNIISGQLKLGHSGHDDGEKNSGKDSEKALSVQESIELETITASKSLEEILGMNNNFTSDTRKDTLDMSDPAFESLFKLFSTDREAFLRRESEKDKHEEEMKAELEVLERSVHELESANMAEFAASQGDEGYETHGISHNSPHFHQDQATSTPCGNSVPVLFTPMLQDGSDVSSPFQSRITSGNFTEAHPSATPQPQRTVNSQHSVAQGFGSPVTSPQSLNSGYISETPYPHSSPATPITHGDQLANSNPSTPAQLSSPGSNATFHSTPHGPPSVRTHTSQFPHNCSPLVKADLHAGSPIMAQKGGPRAKQNIFPAASSEGMCLTGQSSAHSQWTSQLVSDSGTVSTPVTTADSLGYLNLLNDATDISNNQVLQEAACDLLNSIVPCSTVENSIDCISIPKSEPTFIVARKHGQGKGKKGKRKLSKNAKAKEQYSTIKGLLGKPPVPVSQPFVPIPITPEKKGTVSQQKIKLLSPGGTEIDVPVIDCQDLQKTESSQASAETVTLFNQDFNTSSEFVMTSNNSSDANGASVNNQTSIVTENAQSTVTDGSITVTGGKTTVAGGNTEVNVLSMPVLPSILLNTVTLAQQNFVNVPAQMENADSGKKKRGRKKKVRPLEDEASSEGRKTPVDQLLSQTKDQLVDLGPGENYTATPITDNLMNKTHVRSLNFGPNVEETHLPQYRRICPKPQKPATSQVIIVHTNAVVSSSRKTGENDTESKGCQKAEEKEIIPKTAGEKQNDKKENKVTSPTTKDKMERKSLSSEPREIDSDMPRMTRQASKLKKNEKKTNDSEMDEKSKKGEDTEKSSSSLDDSGSSLESDTVKVKGKQKGRSPASNSGKTKAKKVVEKLKVRIPVKEKSKNHTVTSGRVTLFSYKRQETEHFTDDSNSTDDIPLSELKCKLSKRKNIDAKMNDRSDLEDLEQVHSASCTPVKVVTELAAVDTTPSKEEMLEKVGLTPKKLFREVNSPNKVGLHDVVAAWEVSPEEKRSAGKHSRFTRSQMKNLEKSLTTSPRKSTLTKTLFSPQSGRVKKAELQKKKSEKVVKLVDKIIKGLHKNNPDSALVKTVEEKQKKDRRGSKSKPKEHRCEKEIKVEESWSPTMKTNTGPSDIENVNSLNQLNTGGQWQDTVIKTETECETLNSKVSGLEANRHNLPDKEDSNMEDNASVEPASRESALSQGKEMVPDRKDSTAVTVDAVESKTDGGKTSVISTEEVATVESEAKELNSGKCETLKKQLDVSVSEEIGMGDEDEESNERTDKQDFVEQEASATYLVNLMNNEKVYGDDSVEENKFLTKHSVGVQEFESRVNDIHHLPGDQGNSDTGQVSENEDASNEVGLENSTKESCNFPVEKTVDSQTENEATGIESESKAGQTVEFNEMSESHVGKKKKKHKKKHRHSHGQESVTGHKHKHGSKHRKHKHKQNDKDVKDPSESPNKASCSHEPGVVSVERKHRHRHRKDGERHCHRHKKKREKRLREEDSDSNKAKRRRLDSSALPDHLADLNVEEALSKFYG